MQRREKKMASAMAIGSATGAAASRNQQPVGINKGNNGSHNGGWYGDQNGGGRPKKVENGGN